MENCFVESNIDLMNYCWPWNRRPGFYSRGDFFFHFAAASCSGFYLPDHLMGTSRVIPWVKLPHREFFHYSPTSTPEIKIMCSFTIKPS